MEERKGELARETEGEGEPAVREAPRYAEARRRCREVGRGRHDLMRPAHRGQVDVDGEHAPEKAGPRVPRRSGWRRRLERVEGQVSFGVADADPVERGESSMCVGARPHGVIVELPNMGESDSSDPFPWRCRYGQRRCGFANQLRR